MQVKTPDTQGYSAVLQVTWGHRLLQHPHPARAGALRQGGGRSGRRLVELRLDDASEYEVGQELTADVLQDGELVDATAVSKGKGFAGAMKRHNLRARAPATATTRTTAPRSIGACATPALVFKGTKMAGRMGGHQVTTRNLEIVHADTERELVLVKGAVPGPRAGWSVLRNTVKAPAVRQGPSERRHHRLRDGHPPRTRRQLRPAPVRGPLPSARPTATTSERWISNPRCSASSPIRPCSTRW